ncbi:hypothetical protein NKR74_21740 [Bacillus sp. 3103sda1]|nr:hypothetical protein [Bacillus sp. 3103sda1]MCP1125895.1 hypothetical protein [Bacillus sp. 3103sda1]
MRFYLHIKEFRKSPIGSTNHQWGMKPAPLMEVSLYDIEGNGMMFIAI